VVSCVRFDTALRHYGVSVRRRTKDDSEVPRWPLPLAELMTCACQRTDPAYAADYCSLDKNHARTLARRDI
jgi:hypothetical protein